MLTNYFLPFIYISLLGWVNPAPENIYDTAKLSAELKENAHAVIRKHETVFTVKSMEQATEKVHYAVTILDENAEEMNTEYVSYDKFKKVVSFKGTLYDKNGKEIKQLKKSDIQDMSLSTVASSGLMDDNRLKAARLSSPQYPYTVEFEYELSLNGLLFYPVWQPQSRPNISVSNATFQVIVPEGMTFRHKEKNQVGQPVKTTLDRNQVYTWEVANLPARERLPFQPPMDEVLPIVFTAPDDFEIEGYKGNMKTWENFGKWINQLNAGKEVLPEATVAKLKALVADAPDDLTKIQRLYQHLQANTRYISIQLGIGGWQPFEASFVDSKGYGDCKALSNYMHAMLKAVGIKSFYTLILAGDDEADIQVDFPSNQFNHVVVCVPMAKDSLWLECTSQSVSAGYAGGFTGNRHALLITPEGGKIARTPVYKAQENLQKRTATVKLDLNGNALAQVETIYTGLQQDNVSNYLTLGADEQKKWLYKRVQIPSFDINKFTFQEKKGRIPEVKENLDLSVNKYASLTGQRLFLTLNMLNQERGIPSKVGTRSVDVVTDYDYLDVDNIRYQLPSDGFQVEFLPEPQVIKSVFGEYAASVKMENGVLVYSRSLKMNKGRFPASSYTELQDFYRKISKADKVQVVLAVKKT